jgi:hypothetical protein
MTLMVRFQTKRNGSRQKGDAGSNHSRSCPRPCRPRKKSERNRVFLINGFSERKHD